MPIYHNKTDRELMFPGIGIVAPDGYIEYLIPIENPNLEQVDSIPADGAEPALPIPEAVPEPVGVAIPEAAAEPEAAPAPQIELPQEASDGRASE